MPRGPIAQLKVRLEPELREKLERSATDRGVSLNKELSDRLQRSLEYDYAPGRRNQSVQAILRIVEEAMNAAGDAALFTQTLSWNVARQKNWVNDPYAYRVATEAAIEILKELTPQGDFATPEHGHDGRFWAEFFLKQAATGEGHVPETQPLARALHAGLGELADRIAAMAKINPRKNAEKRASNRTRS